MTITAGLFNTPKQDYKSKPKSKRSS